VIHTISAASVPAMENSRSAYFFQYPKKSGNLVKKRLYTLRMLAMAFKLELRFSPPSAPSTQRINASHVSKSSGSYSYTETVSNWTKEMKMRKDKGFIPLGDSICRNLLLKEQHSSQSWSLLRLSGVPGRTSYAVRKLYWWFQTQPTLWIFPDQCRCHHSLD